MREFYVYAHRRKTDNKIYYIGKGKGNRAWNLYTKERNIFWQNTHNKHGTIVEIILDKLTEQEAHSIETEFILFYGRKNNSTGTLVNMTDGGEGVSGKVFSSEERSKISNRFSGVNNPNFDKRLWEFINIDSGETVLCTKYDFKLKYGISPFPLFKGICSERWIVSGVNSEERIAALKSKFSGEWAYNKAPKVHFVNFKTMEERIEHPSIMSKFIGMNLSDLLYSGAYRCGDWTTKEALDKHGIHKVSMAGTKFGAMNPRADKSLYKFINVDTNVIVECTRVDMLETYSVDVTGLFSSDRPRTSVKDWMLYSNYLDGKRPLKDNKVYLFENESLNTIMECTRKEFIKITGKSCRQLFCKNPVKTVAGWKLIKD